MKFKNSLEREFWEKVYIAAVRNGLPAFAARNTADDALTDLRERV